MGEFFRGRRRKIGVLTLAAALAVMAAWGRSQSNPTTFSAPIDAMTEYGLQLDPERIAVTRTRIVLPTDDQQVTTDDDGTVIIENKASEMERDDRSIGDIAKTRYLSQRNAASFKIEGCV